MTATTTTRLALALLIAVAGCSDPVHAPPAEPAAEFRVEGDAESPTGASWTFKGTVDGVRYDLQGVLLKPRGNGPFPAVVISHGAGGSAAGYSRQIAAEMVRWGMVAMATNYTHAGNVPLGAPGAAEEPGASRANVLRAHMTRELLRRLGYVDLTRVAAHGHSMGAFVTTAVVAAYPADFRAASHTAGGVRPNNSSPALPAPTEAQAAAIRTPYQLHHGDRDFVVNISSARLMDQVLTANGVVHELHVYAGYDHNQITRDSVMFSRVRAWYARHGIL